MRVKIVFLFLVVFFSSTVVLANDWSADAIESVKERGVMIGYGDGAFRAKQAATREELAVVVDRVMDIIEEDTGDVYIIQAEPKTNWIFGIVCAILGVVVGMALGFIIGRKKIEINPIVNVAVPEINPVINVQSGGQVGSHGDLSGGSMGKKEFVGLEEEKYKPSAATFKDELGKDSESSITIKEERGSEDKESIDSDLDKLKKIKGE